MFSRIEVMTEKMLVGTSIQMSFVTNTTSELWKNFMPKIISNFKTPSPDLYSVEVYNDVHFFNNFNPEKNFIKWAAIEADALKNSTTDLETLIIPTGLYAVFIHIGLATDGYKTYEYIFNTWLPSSIYTLDNRPHFALMGTKYKNNDASSEEEIWIPVQKRNAFPT